MRKANRNLNFAAIKLPRFRLPKLVVRRRRPFKPARRMLSSRRLPVSARRIKEQLFKLSVFMVIALIIFGLWQVVRPGVRVRANPDTVAAFRVPHRAIGLLEGYAHRYNIPFAELFAIFNVENGFFPEKSAVYDLSVLEQLYVVDFDRILRRYNSRSLAPFVDMYANLFSELIAFPVPLGWYDIEPSIMYGDSWGVEHNFQGNRMHMGTAIIDRENIRGRVPIVSMTHGHIQEAGWNNQLGYFVGIVTTNGTYYLYAHLDSLVPELAVGQSITAGHPLGFMGNSGGGRSARTFPVHLHIGISPDVSFTRGRFWINPYPFLRFMEGREFVVLAED